MKESPIFIHSLFRAGSTYLFKVFRRSAPGYWCYQEPLHEIAVFSRDNPAGLQQDHGEEKARLLRHPEVDGAYFRELQEIWPAWKDAITEPIIYDAYFLGEKEDIGIPYWQALVEAARGRAVFQECRTSGRIGAIKSRMGGYHIYLWRNPWDQWWSYKVTTYFDVANLLIIHASHAPQPVQHMLSALQLPVYEGKDLTGAFAFYGESPLTSEQSYLVFYLLWCLGMHEGMQHADLMLSIDRLSDSADYRSEMLARLKDAGIDGIDFSDCRIPQGWYFEKEQAFFRAMEGRVHKWLIEGGWTQQDIDQIEAQRQLCQPAIWSMPIQDMLPTDLAEQASRARELVKRFETTLGERVRNDALRLSESEAKAEQAEKVAAESRAQVAEAQAEKVAAESRAQVAEAQAEKVAAESRAQVAEAQAERAHQLAAHLAATQKELHDVHQSNHHHWQQWEATKQELSAVHQSNHNHWQLAEERQQALQAIQSSWSWRITAPLRWVAAPIMQRDGTGAVPPAPTFPRRFIRWGMAQPRLVAGVHHIVDRFPLLRKTITRHVANAMSPSVPADDGYLAAKLPVNSDVSPDLSNMAPRARQIYADLKSALARRQQGNG